MALPQQNPNIPADRARAMLGHSDRSGGQNTSWNAAHMSQGCTKPSTPGALADCTASPLTDAIERSLSGNQGAAFGSPRLFSA
jgi:hypothetical protein